MCYDCIHVKDCDGVMVEERQSSCDHFRSEHDKKDDEPDKTKDTKEQRKCK